MPPVPHVAFDDVLQLLLLSQHPELQDVESQTHFVPLQRCPGVQVAHPPPPEPQADGISVVTQVVPLQQPLGQDVALHTHDPVELHACPVAQGWQAAPPTPQVMVFDVWHMPLLSQHPLGHDFASQTHRPWALHSWLVPQGRQATPPSPHCVFDGVVTHTPLPQHPAQLAPAQLQAPPEHDCPVEHLPQALPFAPQTLTLCADVRTHWLFVSQHPPEHDAGVQTHCPALLQAWAIAQDPHAAPAAPQFVRVWEA
jgi:hypothetical protein